MGSYVSKRPSGYASRTFFIDNEGTAKGIRVGIIQRIDEINMKADIKILTGAGIRFEVELSQSMCGPRSFWGGVPEVGSLVLVGYRDISRVHNLAEAVILGYLPMGNRLGIRYDTFAPSDPTDIDPEDADFYAKNIGRTVRYKRFKLSPGDVGGMSSNGAELSLNRSVNMANRAGDLIELRDDDRTLVTQTLHRFDSDAGVRRLSGPVRRQVFWMPSEIMNTTSDGSTLKSEADGYRGRDEFQSVGPGDVGSNTKFSNANGRLIPEFNNATQFPPVTYSNGKTVFYPSLIPDTSIEGDPDTGAGSTFTEVRTEIYHDTDLVPDVTTEIDGFDPFPKATFIEHVMGTVVGNDPYSTLGIEQYGQVLRPQIWTSGTTMTAGSFSLEAIDRGARGDADVRTSAAAYLFRINPVQSNDESFFAVSVQKQGKLLVQVPKPANDAYNDNVKGVSADVNLLGALKMFVGAASPSNTSMFAKFEGGIKAEIGRNSDTGSSLDIVYNGPVKSKFVGANDPSGNGLVTEVNGRNVTTVSGDHDVATGGSVNINANGSQTVKASKIVHHATSGYTLNAAGYQANILGKTTLTYAELKTETIVTGGEIKTVVAGAVVENIAGGALSTTVNGAVTVNSTAAISEIAGAAFNQTSGGAFTVSAGAAYSLTATAAVSITAGGLLNQVAPAGISMVSPNIMLGGPTAVLGVARATPLLPPGVPTLDYITGLPIQGSASVRSI